MTNERIPEQVEATVQLMRNLLEVVNQLQEVINELEGEEGGC